MQVKPVNVGTESPTPEAPEFNDYCMRHIAAINADNVIETMELAAKGLKDSGNEVAIRASFEVIARVRYPKGYLNQ